MKGKVKFPFRVKCNGEYYAPGDTVKVDDVDEAVSRGAEIISTDKEKNRYHGRTRKRKAPEKGSVRKEARQMAYADYTFYTEVYYGDQISEENFPKMSERASDYIRAVTKGISDNVTNEIDITAVKKAMCAVSEIIQDEIRITSKAFSGEATVSSETVGSWSRSYGTTSLSDSEIEYLDNRKKDALLLYIGNLLDFASIFKVRSYPCLH